MFRRVCMFLAIVSFVLVATPGFAHEHIVRTTIPHDETYILPVGPLTPCVGYSGTVTLMQNGVFHITEFVSGPQAGRVLLREEIAGTLTIEPSGPTMGPAYSGAFAGHYTAQFEGGLEAVEQGPPRVGSFTTHITATGADGSALKLLMHGLIVMKDGEVKNQFFKVHCIKP
jgi:hypothetical protein